MKKKILFVVCLLVGLMFINSGLNKLFNYLPMPPDLPEKMLKVNAAFAEIGWLMPLVAFTEIIGGFLFITNRFRALGAIMLFPVTIGILLIHILQVPAGTPLALIFFAVVIWAMIENRDKYMPLISGEKTTVQ